MADRKTGPLGVLLLFTVFALGIAFFGLSGLAPRSHDRAAPAAPGPGMADLRADGVLWRVRDADGDGQADYVYPAERGTALGLGTYQSRAGRALFAATLDGERRWVASELLRVKSELGFRAATPLDLDRDGRADCVVDIADQAVLVARRDDAPCPGRLVAAPLSPDWSRVSEALRLETKLAALLARR